MTTPLTEEELREIRERERAATQGHWNWWTSCSFRRLSTTSDSRDGGVMHAFVARDGQPDISVKPQDMAFIEHARSDIPRLLDMVEALQADREALLKAVRAARRRLNGEMHGQAVAYAKAWKALPEHLKVEASKE